VSYRTEEARNKSRASLDAAERSPFFRKVALLTRHPNFFEAREGLFSDLEREGRRFEISFLPSRMHK